MRTKVPQWAQETARIRRLEKNGTTNANELDLAPTVFQDSFGPEIDAEDASDMDMEEDKNSNDGENAEEIEDGAGENEENEENENRSDNNSDEEDEEEGLVENYGYDIGSG